jgi:poly(3-hydroxybutyrate) depolymerase
MRCEGAGRLAVIAICGALCSGCGSSNGQPDEGPSPDLAISDSAGADRPPTEAGRLDGKPGPTKPCGFKTGTQEDVAAGTNTAFTIGGQPRFFLVLKVNVPAGHAGKLPVVFAYHGYDSKAVNFNGGSWAAASNMPHLKVVPQAVNPSTMPVWDFESDPAASVDLRFFDEMLGCLNAEFPVDNDRVHVVGSSMGGIFAAYVFTHRGNQIASFALSSGGFATPFSYCTWSTAQLVASLGNRAPGLVIWGGPSDVAIWDFDAAAKSTIQTLRGNGHFVIQCNHGLGHDWSDEMNPFLYRFLEDHPRGVKPDPYAGGLPTTAKWGAWPSFCSIAP